MNTLRPSSIVSPAPEVEAARVYPIPYPDYTMDVTGKCPCCGEWTWSAPCPSTSAIIDWTFAPRLRGRKTTMRFKMFHPGAGSQDGLAHAVHLRRTSSRISLCFASVRLTVSGYRR